MSLYNTLINKIKTSIHSSKMEKKWRRQNKHNSTFLQWIPKGEEFFAKVKVGNYCYGPIRAIYSGNPIEKLEIGNYCSIGSGTTFILGSEHSYKSLSTFPFKVKCLGEEMEAHSKGPIILHDDVWVGEDVLFLSGVTVGKGAVIAARSVVVKNVPPYAIVGGNPAKVIKYRFTAEIINELMSFDLNEFNNDFIRKNLDLIYEDLTESNFRDILSKLSKVLKAN
jgi:acetyltransferase-like isoleucine patch superfamily enzyme